MKSFRVRLRGAVLGGLMAWFGVTASGSESASSVSLAVVGPLERKNPISIVVSAQVLAIQLQIQSGTDDWEIRLRDVEAVRAQLADAAQKQRLRLQTMNGLLLQSGYGKGLFSSAGRTEVDIRSNVLLIANVDEKSDLVALVRQMRLLVTRLPLPKGVSLAIGEARLGLEDAEKLRPRLLERIREHIDATATALGSGVEVVVTGFEEPVQAQQVQERSVELSLPIKVSYTRRTK